MAPITLGAVITSSWAAPLRAEKYTAHFQLWLWVAQMTSAAMAAGFLPPLPRNTPQLWRNGSAWLPQTFRMSCPTSIISRPTISASSASPPHALIHGKGSLPPSRFVSCRIACLHFQAITSRRQFVDRHFGRNRYDMIFSSNRGAHRPQTHVLLYFSGLRISHSYLAFQLPS